MGDMGEEFKEIRDERKARRAQFGVECPECKRLLPKACATILLPGQRCSRRGHNYRDPRPRQ
jgi:RNase P subunit RPR2